MTVTVLGWRSLAVTLASRKKRRWKPGILVLAVLRVEDLERDRTIQRRLDGLVHAAHAAGAERLQDLEALVEDPAQQGIHHVGWSVPGRGVAFDHVLPRRREGGFVANPGGMVAIPRSAAQETGEGGARAQPWKDGL